MPADNDLDPVDRWLNQQVWPMAPPDGTFEQITRRARRRKVRNAAVSVTSAAAVAVAVAISVSLGLLGGLGSSGPGRVAIAASGTKTPGGTTSQSPMGTGTKEPSSTAKASVLPSSTGSSTGTLGPNSPGWLPGQFIPATVTWVSQSEGYVMGQAGTKGQCGAHKDSDICTSIAVTHDYGKTWAGVPAPVTRAASGLTGVSQMRFLDGVNGWAYGPELWATHDGGLTWKQVKAPPGSNQQQVTDLETVNLRAYALWADCTDAATCRSYTLMSTPAGEDVWTPVSGVPANLSAGGNTPGSASFELGGTHGYLIAPDGSLYLGTLPENGSPSTWQRAPINLPCNPTYQVEGSYGQSLQVLLASYWAGGTQPPTIAVACEVDAPPQGFSTTVWISTDNGATWAEQKNVGNAGVSFIGKALSLAATSKGGLILATQRGIYRLPPGASQWQQSVLSGAAAPPYGFTYVGMTSDSQGVAIADSAAAANQPAPNPYGIWMTFDSGQTWQFRAIKSKSS